VTDAPQSAGLFALADRIELWPIDRLRPCEHILARDWPHASGHTLPI
jgi:hypothetical protein